MTVRITETAIAAAARRASAAGKLVEVIDAGMVGLRLRVSPRGPKQWVVATRDAGGAMRRFFLGEYPHVGISEARTRAAVVRGEVKAGADPMAEARERRQQREAETLGAVVDLYRAKAAPGLKSWAEYRRRISSVFAALLDRPAARLTIGALQMTVDDWPSPQSAAAAVRYLRPILKWAAAPGRRYVSRDLLDLAAPATVVRRDRVLSREELARLLPGLQTLATPYHGAMLLMLLTATRREEAGAATWADIDTTAGVWRIAETKNGRPHLVPLSRQARALLAAIRPENPTPEMLVFATSGGKRLDGWDRATKAIMRETGTERWHRHDLRRTAATLMGEAGTLPHIIEAALNHASLHSQLAATYNRSRYQPDVAEALQRLADILDGIAAGAAEVVALHGRT